MRSTAYTSLIKAYVISAGSQTRTYFTRRHAINSNNDIVAIEEDVMKVAAEEACFAYRKKLQPRS